MTEYEKEEKGKTKGKNFPDDHLSGKTVQNVSLPE